jgi:hypothetical protein
MANFGRSSAYAVLAAAGITNTGSSVISGGVIGSFPTASITGFPPGQATIDNADAAGALADALVLYNALSALTFVSLGGALDLSTAFSGSNVVTPGNYSFGAATCSQGLVLSGAGVYIFKGSSTVNLASGKAITLTNGATAANVYWLVGSSLTTVATSTFVGNILANTSITLGGGTLNGRALAGVVTSSGAVSISAMTAITAPSELQPAPANFINVSGSVGIGGILIQIVPTHFNIANPQILFAVSDAAGNYSFVVPTGQGGYLVSAHDPAGVYVYLHKEHITASPVDVADVNLSGTLLNASNANSQGTAQ